MTPCQGDATAPHATCQTPRTPVVNVLPGGAAEETAKGLGHGVAGSRCAGALPMIASPRQTGGYTAGVAAEEVKSGPAYGSHRWTGTPRGRLRPRESAPVLGPGK